jgi:hypothetical protein
MGVTGLAERGTYGREAISNSGRRDRGGSGSHGSLAGNGCSVASVAQPLICGAEMVGTGVGCDRCVFSCVVQTGPAAEA